MTASGTGDSISGSAGPGTSRPALATSSVGASRFRLWKARRLPPVAVNGVEAKALDRCADCQPTSKAPALTEGAVEYRTLVLGNHMPVGVAGAGSALHTSRSRRHAVRRDVSRHRANMCRPTVDSDATRRRERQAAGNAAYWDSVWDAKRGFYGHVLGSSDWSTSLWCWWSTSIRPSSCPGSGYVSGCHGPAISSWCAATRISSRWVG